jgi:hypothetical protein
VAWDQTQSPSFVARHERRDAEDVVALLELLEGTREELAAAFGADRLPQDVTVVVHGSDTALALAAPAVVLVRRLTAPAARRYVAGWAAPRVVHVLAPRLLRARASSVEGSRELALLAPAALYARLVVGALNPSLPPPHTARAIARYPRWAWQAHGAAEWLAGQTPYTRPAIARRLREGGRPAFPPGPRDAMLLGGTVVDLLAGERGAQAAIDLILAPAAAGPLHALTAAFGDQPLGEVEAAWRAHLVRVAGRG